MNVPLHLGILPLGEQRPTVDEKPVLGHECLLLPRQLRVVDEVVFLVVVLDFALAPLLLAVLVDARGFFVHTAHLHVTLGLGQVKGHVVI